MPLRFFIPGAYPANRYKVPPDYFNLDFECMSIQGINYV